VSRAGNPLPLAGAVAVVAGATRGAGRGIARALGEAGAIVYCTGRSMRGRPSPYNRPETIEETAESINAAGASAIALQVDHTAEAEVAALFERVEREQGRLDILVNSIAGEDPMMAGWSPFWKVNLSNAEALMRQALVSRVTTAQHAARLMIRRRRGLIVEVTENDLSRAATFSRRSCGSHARHSLPSTLRKFASTALWLSRSLRASCVQSACWSISA
jgi:NAD(P)-dependent dehydrogenase (short-subunit alcohol dehydrogenase family)